MFLTFLTSVVLAASNYIVLFKPTTNSKNLGIMQESRDNITRMKMSFNEDDYIIKTMFNGFTARLTNNTVKHLQNDPTVEIIEEDKTVKIASFKIKEFKEYKKPHLLSLADHFILQKDAPWGISRISGHNRDYEYLKNSGKNVSVYVIDTGVDINHSEFDGRASWGFNAIPGSPNRDEHGHGTHCAGTIAGKIFGIAKNANIIAVKVLDFQGEGMISSIIEGIDFVMRDYEEKLNEFYNKKEGYLDQIKNSLNSFIEYVDLPFLSEKMLHRFNLKYRSERSKPKAVVNMSVGGSKSAALNFAIKYATSHMGIHFATAAGNEHQNACEFSPASSGYSMTIGASNKDNIIAPFSNIGTCVDVYAPGTDIMSSWPNNKARIASGTSMATPHVAGVMNLV